MRSPFESVLDRSALLRMAGGQSYDRGVGYHANGRVRALLEQDGAITAKVRGTREYRVKLWTRGDKLGFSCTCPVGDDGSFCKHCVAVGLLRKIDSLMERLGRSREFAQYLESVRFAHKPKRNFMKMLERTKWS